MVKLCSIPLCKGVASKQYNIKLHKFPTSEELRHIWQERIKSYYPSYKITNSSLVCSKHFIETDFIQSARSTTKSLCKNAIPSLFDVEECVNVFLDEERHDGSSIIIAPSENDVTPTKSSDSIVTSQFNDHYGSPIILGPSDLDVLPIKTFDGVETSSQLDEGSNNPEPFHIVDVPTDNLDIPCSSSTDVLQITPKTMSSRNINNPKRKILFGDFKLDDLNTPRKRQKYWNVSQKTVKTYKIKTKQLHNTNAWLKKRVENLSQLVKHLKDEKKISENCFCALQVEKHD